MSNTRMITPITIAITAPRLRPVISTVRLMVSLARSTTVCRADTSRLAARGTALKRVPVVLSGALVEHATSARVMKKASVKRRLIVREILENVVGISLLDGLSGLVDLDMDALCSHIHLPYDMVRINDTDGLIHPRRPLLPDKSQHHPCCRLFPLHSIILHPSLCRLPLA